MLKEKDILKGKYQILSLVGRGGMSVVWLAEDLELKKKWAVKEIDKTSAAYRNARSRDGQLTEIEILNCLDSPFAPRIVDCFEDDRVKCVVMDYIEGRSLASMLEDGTIPKDPELILSWMMDICSLLSYLHKKNIVYRDMKPANILLTADGSVKVVDYGIAKFAQPGHYEDEAAVGTKGYAAPEQYRKISSPRSDIYSVCVTLRQLLAGTKRPVGAGRSLQNLPAGLAAILEKGCEKDPEKRFETVDQLRDALSSFEKFDELHVRGLRRKIRTARVLKTAAVVCFTLGLLLFTAGVGQDSVEYKRLVSTDAPEASQRIAAYREAARLKPYSPTACAKMLECCREDGLSSAEMQEIGGIYEVYRKYQWIPTRSYADLSREIALALLCDSEELQPAAKALAQARSYLENCCAAKDSDDLAKGLLVMARVWAGEQYVSEDNAENFLDIISGMTDCIGVRFGRRAAAENLRLYALTAEFLQDYAQSFAAAGREDEAKIILSRVLAEAEKLKLQSPEAALRLDEIAGQPAGGKICD